ncbi:MAG TPA: response regulator [Ktedonobacterales bacterium]|nr:response regulator [Ktedonobacterales bacterium]
MLNASELPDRDERALSNEGDAAGPTIMVIDDSLAVRRVVEASFSRIGIPTTSFPDGLSAISALTKGEVTVPSLLLLDIVMPKMEGYEVARILRTNQAFENTIIVMLTGREGVIDRLRSKMVGARDYIKKPFRVSQLVETVCGHLGLPSS